MKKFRVTMRFINGILEGLTIEEYFPFPFPVGFVAEKPIGGAGYIIEACVEVTND